MKPTQASFPLWFNKHNLATILANTLETERKLAKFNQHDFIPIIHVKENTIPALSFQQSSLGVVPVNI